MIPARQIKFIRSLQQKKFRDSHGLFVAEGEKTIAELAGSPLHAEMICALPAWVERNKAKIQPHTEIITVSPGELKRISGLKSPNQALAVIRKPSVRLPQHLEPQELIPVLDKIQDPGNLGTIIRTADWFGIRHIICSPCTADVFNPKVIQATMGSFMRVNVHYTTLSELPDKLWSGLSVYGAFAGGENVFTAEIKTPAILVIGNESQGISEDVKQWIDHPLGIPRGHKHSEDIHAESLNAAVAAGIIMAQFREKGL